MIFTKSPVIIARLTNSAGTFTIPMNTWPSATFTLRSYCPSRSFGTLRNWECIHA